MLLLAPTTFELKRIAEASCSAGTARASCGFGLCASAAGASRLLAAGAHRRCVLAGLAGSYDLDRLPLGSLVLASRVHCHGIGAGEGAGWIAPSAMGLPQIEGHAGGEAIYEELRLEVPDLAPEIPRAPLVSVASCSASIEQALQRCTRFDGALAEDMESFAVALACRLAGVELVVLRAISNRAGVRDKRSWAIEPALAALRDALPGLVEWSLRAEAGRGSQAS